MKKLFILSFVLLCTLLLTGCGSSNPQMICTIEKDSGNNYVTGKLIADLDGDKVTSVRVEYVAEIKEEYYNQMKDKANFDTVMDTFETTMVEQLNQIFKAAHPNFKSKVDGNKITLSTDLSIPDGYKEWGTKDSFSKGYTGWDCKEQ